MSDHDDADRLTTTFLNVERHEVAWHALGRARLSPELRPSRECPTSREAAEPPDGDGVRLVGEHSTHRLVELGTLAARARLVLAGQEVQ